MRPPLRFAAPIRWLVLLAAGAVAGCSGDDPPAMPAVVRITDVAARAGDASFEAAVDLARPPASDERGLLDTAERPLAPVRNASGAAPVAEQLAALMPASLALELREPGFAPDLAVAAVPLSGGAVVRLAFDAKPADGLAFGFELDHLVAPEQITSPDFLLPVLTGRRSFIDWLEPAGGATQTKVVTAEKTTKMLLVGVIGRAAPLRVVETTALGRLHALPAVTLDGGGASPWVREVSIASEVREALVLAPPAEARFRLRVPERSPWFTAGAANYLDGSRARNRLRVTVEAAEGAIVAAEVVLEGNPDAWREVEVDLAPLAGQDVELVLRVSREPGSDQAPGRGAVVVGAPRVEERPAPDRDLPHDVVLISLDTLRADRASAPATTPALHALGASSCVFDRAIAPAPWTLPSHVSMLSGQYPDRHGAYYETSRIHRETPLLTEDFRRAGYETIGFTGGGYVSPEFGFTRAFDRYSVADPAFPPADWAAVQADEPRKMIQRAEASAAARKRLLELLADEAPPRPRFVFIHTYAAHNYAASADLLRDMGVDAARIDDLMRGVTTARLNKFLEEEPPEDAARAAMERARFLYDASARAADALVADVVAALERAGRLDRTLLVITSDHGESLFERGWIGHGRAVHEELIRVPLLVRGPGVAAGRHGHVVSLVDVAPTLRDVCGLAPGDGGGWGVDGRSLAPLLAGGEAAARFPEVPALARGERPESVVHTLRDARAKFIATRDLDGTESRELFDLRDDPGESADLAPRRAEETERYAAALARWIDDLVRAGPGSARADLGADKLAELRGLGYLGD